MMVKFWGVRGSIPVANKKMLKYGGNTSCVELNIEDKRIIFDSGTGIIDLGQELAKNKEVKEVHIFISHYHLDHILGLAFFKPFYIEDYKIKLYGPKIDDSGVKEILSKLITPPFFPIPIEGFSANIEFINIEEDEELLLGKNVSIETTSNLHPGVGLYYNLKYKDKNLSYITDIEIVEDKSEKIEKFIQSADLSIIDSNYTEKEYRENRLGWGHSSWEKAVDLAKRSDVKKLILFHHDINRTDSQIEEIERLAKVEFQNTYAAREGMVIEI